MISSIEYGSVIKFLLLWHSETAEITQRLWETYKKEYSARTTIYKWIQLFKSDHQSALGQEKENTLKFLRKKDLC